MRRAHAALAVDIRAAALEDMARFANSVYRNSLMPRALNLAGLRERAAKLRGADHDRPRSLTAPRFPTRKDRP